MIVIDKQSRVPVYEQIKNQIVTLIRLGIYQPDSKLPSIRQISSDVSVNVNTVKKAFAELEMSGIIYSVPGIGSFVSADALENNMIKQKAKSALADALGVSKSVGITKEEIREIIESIYGGEDND